MKSCKASNKKVNRKMDRCNVHANAAEKRIKHDKKLKYKCSSPDLFDDDDDSSNTDSRDSEQMWDGTPLSEFTRLSLSNLNIPPMMADLDHEIYVKLPVKENEVPEPYPYVYNNIWDAKHVKMPNSPDSLYPVEKDGGKKLVNRWSLIEEALSKEITCMTHLQKAILSYNNRYEGRWKFDGLRCLLEEEFCEEEQDYFFKDILPKIIKLALRVPEIVTKPPILLTRHSTRSISLSQKQISSLLANAFLCTYPRRNAKGADTEYANYPEINFNRLFSYKDSCAMEKIKCIIHYFKEVTSSDPDGMVTFTRQSIADEEVPNFEVSAKSLPKLNADTKGLIEETTGLLQVDFANKYIGGGVLGIGCVQEEIRFVLCPEVIVSMLFTEVLDDNEALIITGVEQYNKGRGYASAFEWAGPFHDVTLRDPYKRKLCQLVGLDALRFGRNPNRQYKRNFVMRELHKAYAGFHVLPNSGGAPTAVASGNWGCGVFHGDPKLKSLIQMAAAGEAGRDLAYFTFGDEQLKDCLVDIHQFLVEHSVSVGQLVMVLCQYGASRDNVDGHDLYRYIRHNIGNNLSDSDSNEPMTPVKNASVKMNKAKCITDYFKAIPKSDQPFQSTSSTSSDRHKKEILDEDLLEALAQCEKLCQKSDNADRLESVTSSRQRITSQEDSNSNVKNSNDDLLAKLNEYDEKLK